MTVSSGCKNHGGLAHLGEHLPCKQGVAGSSPASSTNNQRGVRIRGRKGST